ncbi:MAG: hypothetical protein NC127_05270 [Muribaculum sp.]|nr:hypothetical protein [Muribaculum sp.]
MRIASFLLAFIVATHLDLGAGNVLEYQQDFDFKVSLPDTFSPVDTMDCTSFTINPDFSVCESIVPDSRISCIHGQVFESGNMECVFMSPYMTWSIGSLKTQITSELRSAMADCELDTEDYIRVISGIDMSKYANADTMYIYEMELPAPYLGRYKHCIGIHLRKYAHPLAMMKILLTDDGLSRKEEYVDSILSGIQFGDSISDEGLKMEELLKGYQRYNPNL